MKFLLFTYIYCTRVQVHAKRGIFVIDKLKREIKIILDKNIKGYILILAVFISGTILSMILSYSNDNAEMNLYLNDFISNVKNYSIDSVKTFKNSMFGYFRYGVLMFFMSICAVGYIGVLCTVFIKGFFYGTVLDALLKISFSKGITVFFSCVLPHNLIAMPCCMIYSFACIKNALDVSKGAKSIKHIIIKPLLSGMVYCLIISTGALVQAYIEPMLIRMINSF